MMDERVEKRMKMEATMGVQVVDNREQLKEVLESRASFYEMLSYLYFKPLTQIHIDMMADVDFSAYADISEGFADGLNDMTRYLAKKNTGTRQELAVDFTSAFAGTKAYEGKTAVPYKSVFTSEEGLLYQTGHQEVFRMYKNSAVKKRRGLDYPDDHLSFMCEFEAFLSRRVSRTLDAGEYGKALKDLEVSRVFLDTHILSWFDDFVAIANLILKTRFYRGVLKITKGYLELDGQTMLDLISDVKAHKES